MKDLPLDHYRALAEFRFQIRSFLRFSEQASRDAGIEPQQHQVLLAIKGHEPEQATITYLAARMQVRHHSAVELVDRLESHGLVARSRLKEDRRNTVIALTEKGRRILRELSWLHREELQSAVPHLIDSLRSLAEEVSLA